jgi:hypothetical protein
MVRDPETAPPLIRNLQALAEAARQGAVRPEATDHLFGTVGQVARLLESRAAGETDAYPAPGHAPVAGLEDLQDRLARLIDAAGAAGADPAVSEYLRTLLLRLTLIHQQGEGGSRLVPRFAEARTGHLVREGGERGQAVTVVDRSALGFGVVAPEPVSPGEAVRLVIPGDDGFGPEPWEEAYECLAIFCQQTLDGYRVGLDIVEESGGDLG